MENFWGKAIGTILTVTALAIVAVNAGNINTLVGGATKFLGQVEAG